MSYYTAKKPKGSFHLDPIIDLKCQSVDTKNNDGARVLAAIGSTAGMRQQLFDEVPTLYHGFRRGAKLSEKGECLGWRTPIGGSKKKDPMPYRWIKYDDVIRRSEFIARGIVSKGLVPGQTSFVGVYSQNRPEWIITEQACYEYSMVLVPLYDTLGPDACSFIVNQTEMKLVIVDKSNKAEALLEKHESCPTLRILVLIEPAEETLKQKATPLAVEIMQFNELERIGSQFVQAPPVTPPSPEDLCTISYTSGTTGMPKGVMLTHGNVVSDCTAVAMFKYAKVNSEDTMVSFLPLAHMFERVMEACVYMVGGRVGFYRGDIKLLMEDLQVLKPTIMPAVPRLLNRVYDKVMQQARNSHVKRWLIRRALEAKTKKLEERIVQNNSIWDLVFKRVREGMGGRVRLMVTGSAPLGEETLTFVRCALGCIVLEGYGQTECVAACTLTLEGDHTPGHVGPPVPCCQIKLVDVPEMKYLAKDGVGEVCVKGYNVFKGYLKEPQKTTEALDKDGWLHTGDIGRWTSSGALKLIDRKKNLFKLSQGEYIAPEKLENVYVRSRFVGQIYIHGDSLKSCLVAIVSPDPEVLPFAADKELGIKGTVAALCKNEKVKKAIMDDLEAEGKKAGLQKFELVKDIYLHAEPFTVESGLLTPTMKTKRAAVKERFKDQINEMYKTLD